MECHTSLKLKLTREFTSSTGYAKSLETHITVSIRIFLNQTLELYSNKINGLMSYSFL